MKKNHEKVAEAEHSLLADFHGHAGNSPSLECAFERSNGSGETAWSQRRRQRHISEAINFDAGSDGT